MRKIFAEQIAELADSHAQATPRFGRSLVRIGLEAGGAPGARLAVKQGTITSGSTILRRLRSISLPAAPEPVVIGVDDFALRRGQVYGTLFVDHQTHNLIDIIPDRSSEATTIWMSRHESISIVTRDRSGLYAKGIRDARPDAVQVADRWHLLFNAREALIRLLDRHHRQINSAQTAMTDHPSATANPAEMPADAAATSTSPAVSAPAPSATIMPISKARQDSLARRERRMVKYGQVIALREQKMSVRAIERKLGMGRSTILRFLRAGEFPEHARRHMRKSLDGYSNQLRQWWDDGIHNSRELHRRVVVLGFAGSWYCVRRLVAPWRDPQERCTGPRSAIRSNGRRIARISSKRLSWLLVKDDIARASEEVSLISKLMDGVAAIGKATQLFRSFYAIVKQRSVEQLTAWMQLAQAPTSPAEMKGFATGLERDWPVVSAAMEHHWSNGRAEGHVNRIKMIKRKMYGRANFELLRIRVLASGP